MGLIREAGQEILETIALVRDVLPLLAEAQSNPDCEKLGDGTPWPFYLHRKVRRQAEKEIPRNELEKFLKKVASIITVDPYQGKRLTFMKADSGEPVYSLRFAKYRCLYIVRRKSESGGHSVILLMDGRGDVYGKQAPTPPCP